MAPPPGDDPINALVEDVLDAARTPPKARLTSVKPTVARLASEAYERGLLPDALSQLVRLVATPSLLDQASLAAIVRNLYPAERVSRDVVLRVVAALGHGKLKPSLNMQAALIRWLILVYHVLETPAVLSQVYHVLFNLLDTAAIRPQLTHLLALITRRKHVRPFRIQAVLNLSRQTGNDPCLVGLLRVYKDYYPEIIVGDAVRGKASAFKHPDPVWRLQLNEIQEAHFQRTQDGKTQARDGFRVNRPANRVRRSRLVPIVHTSHATEDSVTLEEIENATAFAQNMDKLELPNQLVAVLADPLLQKLLLLRPSELANRRIANWLDAVLQDVVDGNADKASLYEVLDVLCDFVTQTQTFPPLLLDFFARFLRLWNGTDVRAPILDILAYTPLHKFDELYQSIFKPLEDAMLDNSPQPQLELLALYSKILHFWTTTLMSSDLPITHASKSVGSLIRHGNTLALTLLQTAPTVATHCAILDMYEQNVRLISDDNLKHYIRIELPPALLVYAFFFSDFPVVVSRLCGILAAYKESFGRAMATPASGSVGRVDVRSYSKAYVSLYNSFLMDICNCLWRSRAFGQDEPSSKGCLVPRPVIASLTDYVTSVDRTFSLASLFGLSHSPALCLQSIQRLREVEDREAESDSIRTRHAGPPTYASLARLGKAGGIQLSWQDYRIGVLDTMTAKGLGGVSEVLKNTMTVLKNPSQGASQTNISL